MRRLTPLLALALGAWLGGAGRRPAAAADDYAFYHENVMGTSLELRVRARGADDARRAEGLVLAEIDRLAAVFSGHDPSSEFRRWQAAPAAPARVSPELFEMLRASDAWRARSRGAFDPRAQVLTQLWTLCAGRGRLPTDGERAEASTLMARPAWRLDPAAGTAERLSDAPLSLDAIAKGEIVGRACDAAMAGGGVIGLLLNVGGDLRAAGEPARTIGIASPLADSETGVPLAYVEVRDRAVATSGASRRGFRIDGRWYSHIFDPRTAAPAAGVLGATVIAPRSADADALATILNVLTPEEGLRLVAEVPGAECLIVSGDGRVSRSAGWARYERPGPAHPALAAGPVPKDGAEADADAEEDPAPAPKAKPRPRAKDGRPGWGDAFELAIDLEINRPDGQGRRYRRPYVAVWVEDEDGFPVRNLALWVSFGGPGPFQWLPDLKRWYRADQARKLVDKTEMVDAIARPTRTPGKYSLVWDGKDDRGEPLPPGEYTVLIDAAREHGTYQNLRKRVTLADRPFAEELKGNVEIRSASLRYRRRAGAGAGGK